jgi:hypothetical protein
MQGLSSFCGIRLRKSEFSLIQDSDGYFFQENYNMMRKVMMMIGSFDLARENINWLLFRMIYTKEADPLQVVGCNLFVDSSRLQLRFSN